MAEQHGAVIIRDNTGTEHEFPAGFDPVRAAAIVRQQQPPATAGPRDARGMFPTSSHTSDSPADPSPLGAMLGPLAHPETLLDFARLLTVPVDEVRRAAGAALALAATRQGVAAARPAAGAAISATGRGLERVGTATAASSTTLGLVDLMMSHDPVRAAGIAAAPSVLRVVGRGLQRVGGAVTGRVAPALGEVAEGAPVASPIAAAPPMAAPVAPVVPRPPPVAAPAAAARPPITPQDLPASWQQFLQPVAPGPAFKISEPLPTSAAAAAVETPVVPIGKALQAVATVVKAQKIKLTVDEAKAALDLVKRGRTAEDALQAILQQRAFLATQSLPTTTAAKAAIKARGYKS